MDNGDLVKYLPTSTVGKVTDIRERDGVTWVRLDYTDLYYDATTLVPADPSEYIEVSFKERSSFERGMKSIEDIKRETQEVDISEFMPSGGG
ncbi:hypothetical protein AUP07_0617 [methanogenic archaeon mixed culture ISO4-G1]|jgi:hypothetical protein|nr:hypothetical protein AUP07_0617 [methanogenic archaeon mixed culture ISO4-G1]